MTDVAAKTDCPLCVDLDGTLIASDLLHESALSLLRRRPLQCLLMPLWLLRGKAHFKRQLCQRAMPDPALLPYRREVIEFLREQRQSGRRIVLTTGSDRPAADAVAAHLALFDEVIASEGDRNCTGREKLRVLEQRFGERAFDYIGNSSADLPVWRSARLAYMVAPSRATLLRARQLCPPDRILAKAPAAAALLIRAIRPTQWVKNLLIFAPLFASHRFHELHLALSALLAFCAFCLAASSAYLLNDLMDIEADRAHPRKRSRAFASGALSVPAGLTMSLLLMCAGIGVAAWLNKSFLLMLILYLGLTTAYSLHLKRKLLVDVIVLAGLYALRVLAGGAALDVVVSRWLLAFSMFFFISLAFVKRYAELRAVQGRGQQWAEGRNYRVDDLAMIESFGPAAGYMAILVFCLYINSDMAKELYPHPDFLWAVCPVLLYWLTRLWFLARRHQLTDDPIVFALRDRISIIAGATIVLAAYFASATWLTF